MHALFTLYILCLIVQQQNTYTLVNIWMRQLNIHLCLYQVFTIYMSPSKDERCQQRGDSVIRFKETFLDIKTVTVRSIILQLDISAHDFLYLKVWKILTSMGPKSALCLKEALSYRWLYFIISNHPHNLLCWIRPS